MNQNRINIVKTKPQSTGAIKKKKSVKVQTEISGIISPKADQFSNELEFEVLELPDNKRCLKLNNNLSITIKAIENEDSNNKLYGECPICINPFGSQPLSSTICGHVFCTECITNIVKRSRMCPICNKFLKEFDVHPIFLPIERVSF